ncbi:MAG: hypothetical protein JO112_21425 [Planctomycetes bacterium]|nr:hypothetical protein [Planctomycetota bacterium]
MEVVKAQGTEMTKPSDRPIPGQCLAILRHAGEVGEWPNIAAAAVIYFSGDDPRTDKRIPTGADRIFRRLSSEWGVPTAAEARELIEYLREVAAGKSPAKPSLLVPAPTPHLLRSLAILCQGYLLLHASGGTAPPDLFTNGQKRHGTIRHLTDESYRHFLPPDLPRKLDAVKSPLWWRRPFEADFYPSHLAPNQGTDRLIRTVKAEWDSVTTPLTKSRPVLSGDWDKAWANLAQLLNAFKGDQEISPSVVAQAYCALVDALETTGVDRSANLAAATG